MNGPKPKNTPCLWSKQVYNLLTLLLYHPSSSLVPSLTLNFSDRLSLPLSDQENQPEVIYSDPLDALEKATDTRIYDSPEFGMGNIGKSNYLFKISPLYGACL